MHLLLSQTAEIWKVKCPTHTHSHAHTTHTHMHNHTHTTHTHNLTVEDEKVLLDGF